MGRRLDVQSKEVSMKHTVFILLLGLVMAWPMVGRAEAASDKEIRQQMIRESIAAYSGNCPCPYNRDRAGRRCGKRSAWSKPGGAEPLCFEDDVSDEMVRGYRQRAY